MRVLNFIGYIFIASLINLVFSLPALAATINAANCSSPAIQTAINSAVDGDTVIVPAGSCTWTTPASMTPAVSISKGITLQGAGIGQTIITDSTGTGSDDCAIKISGSAGKTIRVTGFEFHGGNSNDYDGAIKVGGTSGWKTFRLDHLKFDSYNGLHMLINSRGLIDHVQAVNVGWTNVIKPNGSGNTDWSSPVTLGSDEALYIEDCTFTYRSGQSAGITAVESYNGARVVLRYSTITNAAYGGHDYCRSGERSSMIQEIYNNTFTVDAYGLSAVDVCGGTGVIFNNTITGDHANMHLLDNKSCSGSGGNCPNLPACDGTDSRDGNTPGQTGWPCLDQVGRSTNQSSIPIYYWSNYINGSLTGPVVRGICQREIDHIQSGRDYVNNGTTPKPGYSPYTYPHPLTLSGPPTGTSPLPPPGNLQLQQ
jgi:hypothetical protein